jgi:hypothetical protein
MPRMECGLDADGSSWWICGRRNGRGRYRRIVGPYESQELLRVLGEVEFRAFLDSAEGNRGPCFFWKIGYHRHPRHSPDHPCIEQ